MRSNRYRRWVEIEMSRIEESNWIDGSVVDKYFTLIENQYNIACLPHNFVQSITEKDYHPISSPGLNEY